jgi:hypothetical protein
MDDVFEETGNATAPKQSIPVIQRVRPAKKSHKKIVKQEVVKQEVVKPLPEPPKQAAKVVEPQTPPKQEQVLINLENLIMPKKATIKKVGREPGMTDESTATKFFSDIKNLQLFINETTFIEFSNNHYFTDNDADISFLRKHPAFGNGKTAAGQFWEGKFPDDVIKKAKKDKDELTNIAEMKVSPDIDY